MDKKNTELHWVTIVITISGSVAKYYTTFIKLARDLRNMPNCTSPVKIYTLKNLKKPYNLAELDRRDLVCVWHRREFHPPEYLDTL